MPGAADDGDAPAARRCPRAGRRTCRCRRDVVAPSRGRVAQRCERVLLVAGSRRRRDAAARAAAGSCGRRELGEQRRRSRSSAPSGPRWWGELPAPRATPSTAPSSRTSATSVFELPPSIASSEPHRRASSSSSERLEQRVDTRRPGRSADGRAAPCVPSTGSRVTAASAVEPLVGGDVLDEPEQLGRERRAAAAAHGAAAPRAPAPRRRRRRRARRASPPFRRSTSCTAPSSARSERDETDRRLAVERAAALLEQRGLLVERRVAVELEQLRARSPRPRRRAGRRRAARRARGRGRRSSGGSRTGARRGRRARCAAGPMCSASSSPCLRAARAGRRAPSTQHGAHPGQVVEADLVDDARAAARRRAARAKWRWKPIATLHRPTARWPGVEQRARDDADGVREVDDPRVGARRARARGRRSAARPAPCASPSRSRPRPSSPGRCSRTRAGSSRRAAAPPGRRRGSARARTSRPSTAASRSVGRRRGRRAKPARSSMRAREPADDVEPLGVDVHQRELVDVELAPRPETSSGVYVEPAPTTAIFIPSPPSA